MNFNHRTSNAVNSIIAIFILILISSCSKPPQSGPNTPADLKPVITSFSPTSASAGDTVLIFGKNFDGATSVSFGGIAAQSFTVISSNKVSAVVGLGETGIIKVTTPQGFGSADGFIFKNDEPKFLLKVWDSQSDYNSEALTFDYDNNKRLSLITCLRWSTKGFVFYKNDTVNHIIFEENNTKRSILFCYDTDKKCKKVIYKNDAYNYDWSSPYFSDTSAGSFYSYDSLAYSTTNQLTGIYHYIIVSTVEQGIFKLEDSIKFIFSSLESKMPVKLQTFVPTYPWLLDEEITIIPDTADNPVYNLGWYMAFLPSLKDAYFRLPTLTPEYKGNLIPRYLCLLKSCIKKYTYRNYNSNSPFYSTSVNYSNKFTSDGYIFLSKTDLPYNDPTLPWVRYTYEKR